jgi:hypothetical protein
MEVNKHNPNLVSLNPFFEKNWYNQNFLKSLIESLKKENSHILFVAQRPVRKLLIKEKLLIDSLINKYKGDFLFTKNIGIRYFGIYFQFSYGYEYEILENIISLWFLYEQPSIIITKEPRQFLKKKDFFNLSSDFFVLKDSFIIYKGVEDDVLWFMKNRNEKFPNFFMIEKHLKLR